MTKPEVTRADAIELLKEARSEIIEKKADMPIKALDAINLLIALYDVAIDELEKLDNAVGEGYLYDWYIHSVQGGEPEWTEEHIKELCQDFILIPKPIKTGGNSNGKVDILR